MKKVLVLFLIVVFMSACAGMDYRYQQNMALNATAGGLVGGAGGAAIASLAHGDVGAGAAIGAIYGAFLGAITTPPPSYHGCPPRDDYAYPPPAYEYDDRGRY
ncbi:MAG: hypothetical protein OS130_02595 [Thermodesulfobacteriota bacterium]|jgi:hypothetical protein|nr:MAG: hypothetical protein OS130_02595 [Thermodesulfobacteriota bacterium]